MNPSVDCCFYYALTINHLLLYYCFSIAVLHHHLELIFNSLKLNILVPLLQKLLEFRV